MLQDAFSLYLLRPVDFSCSVECGECHISLSLLENKVRYMQLEFTLDPNYFALCITLHSGNVTR